MPNKDYDFKQVNEVRIGATVYWKQAENETITQKYGICLVFHGGGFVVGSRHMIPRVEIDHLCDRRYVVVSADYRLCPQVGLREVIQDGVDAFSWCRTDLPRTIRHDAGIELDVDRIVVFGQSAGSLLALHLGSLPDPPKAILDFYGVKYIDNDFWYTPLPALKNLPSFQEAFLNRIYDEPTLTTTATSLERVAPATSTGSLKPQRGLPAPDLSVPRNAWLFTALKNGKHMAAVLKDSLAHEVEPTSAFSPRFPPTMFVHGAADTMIPYSLSEKAHNALNSHDVQTQLLAFQNQNHGFDAGVSTDDVEWPQVRQALDFLISNGNRKGDARS